MKNAKVFKYPIGHGMNVIRLPVGATPVAVAMQHGQLTMWVHFVESSMYQQRAFQFFGTGQDCPEKGFIGTVFDGQFVWHVFEVPV